jgi:hypothetical protein
VADKVRFQTTAENLARLETFEKHGVLIACDNCGQCAIIHRIEVLETIPTARLARASCPHCGKTWELPYSYSSLPLWLATSYRGHSLWALNEQHLSWMESFISAEIREDKLGGGSALHSILPPMDDFFKEPKGHREMHCATSAKA